MKHNTTGQDRLWGGRSCTVLLGTNSQDTLKNAEERDVSGRATLESEKYIFNVQP